MDNGNKNVNKITETDKKLDKMRIELSDGEKCKIIAKKLTEYIKDNK